jgi:hypothetical protein
MSLRIENDKGHRELIPVAFCVDPAGIESDVVLVD